MITLYGMTGSGNCWKAAQALRLAGRAFTWVEIDTRAGETRTPDFLAMNPNGKIPVVELGDGTIITESNAILTHFAEGSTWLPSPGLARTRVMEWLFFEQYSHEPAIAVARALLRFGHRAPDPERLDALHKAGGRALDVMERGLARNPYLAGPLPTIADIALFAYTHVADEGGFELSAWPRIVEWVDRVGGLPGVEPMAPMT